MFAAKNGNNDAIQILLDNRANIHDRTNKSIINVGPKFYFFPFSIYTGIDRENNR